MRKFTFFYSLVQYEKSHDIDPFLVLCQSKEKCKTMNIFWIVSNLTGLFRNPGCHHCPLTLHSSTFACSVAERRVSMSHPSTSDQLWESKHKRKGRRRRRGVYQGKEERDRGEYQKSEEGGGVPEWKRGRGRGLCSPTNIRQFNDKGPSYCERVLKILCVSRLVLADSFGIYCIWWISILALAFLPQKSCHLPSFSSLLYSGEDLTWMRRQLGEGNGGMCLSMKYGPFMRLQLWFIRNFFV